ncbi:N-acetylneuraminate synthase family protein [Alphaproteobacteria bacterium]|nr:N-acetylneuraminate synthase family protein [Alphaproteobacteria bacterium]
MVSLSNEYVIAEMACSHDGSENLAKKIIDAAGDAEANAIQFQIWNIDDLMVKHSPDFNAVSKLQLTKDTWKKLYTYTRSNWPKLDIIACVYEKNSVKFAQKLGVDAYKLHSADLSNPMMLKELAYTGKRIDLSIGASSLNEIDKAILEIRNLSDSDIWLMYGYQLFPTPLENLNLNYMIKLGNLFGLPIGYQDHSDAENLEAFSLPALAIGMGVKVVEKHITHDRKFKGADYQSALNPNEFKNFVSMVRDLNKAKGSGIPEPFSEGEKKYRVYSKKSLVALKDLKAGNKINEEDLVALRGPKIGIPPDCINDLVGRVLNKDILSQQLINKIDLL